MVEQEKETNDVDTLIENYKDFKNRCLNKGMRNKGDIFELFKIWLRFYLLE